MDSEYKLTFNDFLLLKKYMVYFLYNNLKNNKNFNLVEFEMPEVINKKSQVKVRRIFQSRKTKYIIAEKWKRTISSTV